MAIRFPPPLQPGDRIGVTSPSSGVAPNHQPFPCAQTPSLTAAVLSPQLTEGALVSLLNALV